MRFGLEWAAVLVRRVLENRALWVSVFKGIGQSFLFCFPVLLGELNPTYDRLLGECQVGAERKKQARTYEVAFITSRA